MAESISSDGVMQQNLANIDVDNAFNDVAVHLSATRETVRSWKEGAVRELDATRAEMGAMHVHLAETQSELAGKRIELADLRAELEKARAETNRVNTEFAGAQAHLNRTTIELAEAHAGWEQSNADLANVRGELTRTHGELDQTHTNLTEANTELAAVKADRDKWRDDCDHHQRTLADKEAKLARQVEHSRNLHAEVVELYRDLRAEDLPTLVLRIGMNLTGSENALYCDSADNRQLAAIGLDDLSPEVLEGLYSYTRRAAEENQPVICNDSAELPDGSNLVNLAALPVAAQGDIRGVMLVANKRSGPFTDDDTEMLLAIGDHAGIALENSRLHMALGDAYVSTIAVLADAIEAKDPYTRGHCESVSSIAVDVAKQLGWSTEQIEHIRYAALLHDVGKIGIPDGILLKPGRLLPEEYQVIQRHASIGSDLVKRVPSLENIAPIVLHHHERIDGTGYPDGQQGEEISLASRIIGVVDAFDAMTTPRPYREPVSHREAYEELKRCAGKHFDEQIVELVGNVLASREEPNEVATDSPIGV